MARGSLWDELGRDREQRRRSEVARVRAEAQIRKDDRRSTAGTRRGDAAHERAERDAEAVRRQTELDARLTALAGVLRAVVAFPIPTLSDLRDLPPEVEPEPSDEEPPRWADFAPPEPGLLGRLGHNRAVAQARTRFDEEFAEFERRRAAAAERDRTRAAAARADHERRIDELVAAAIGGDADAVPELTAALLRTVTPLRRLVRSGRAVHQPEAAELAVEVELPGTDVVPVEREWRHVVTRRTVAPIDRKPADRAALYADLIGQVTLAVLAICFRAFPPGLVDAVTVNGHITATDPATGRPAHPCLVTVTAARSTFAELHLDNPELDARRCVAFLGAEISPHPYQLEPVQPFVDVDLLIRYRLVTAPHALAQIDHRTDLMDMDPHEFEKLVAALFRAKGYDAWHTQSSRDDGIDAVATKADPYVPTECLIQVKRVRSVVPPKDIQALMGAMREHPTATNGLLVTTSRFSDRTRQRARAQGIATMEGAELGLQIKEHLGRDVVNSAQARR
jgi:restriction system protein